MFGSTEPSSGLILRTDPYHFSSTFGIPSVYIDGVVITYAMLFFILFIYFLGGMLFCKWIVGVLVVSTEIYFGTFSVTS
jgi:hypothetical protein